MEDHVVQTKIAMKNAASFRNFRNIARQPIDQRIHRRNVKGSRCAILICPKADLPSHESLGSTECLQTHRSGVDGVKPRDGLVHRAEYLAPCGAIEFRQPWIPKNSAFHEI